MSGGAGGGWGLSLLDSGPRETVVELLRDAYSESEKTLAVQNRTRGQNSLYVHPWARADAYILHWKNETAIGSLFGPGSYMHVLDIVERGKADTANLNKRPELSESMCLSGLVSLFEAHNAWVEEHYVLAFAQLTVMEPGSELPPHKVGHFFFLH